MLRADYGALRRKAAYVETKVENEFAHGRRAARGHHPAHEALVPYPNNPTGGIMERKDLEAIAEVLRGTDIMVLSDEIYAELTYGQDHVSIANIPGMAERTILVNGFSKSHAMTGWRMGYVCGPKPVIQQMLKIHQYAIMSAPTTSQYAAIEAMANGDCDVQHMRRDYDRRRRLVLDGLRALGLECFEPKGAFYVFPSIKMTGLSSEEFCEQFLLEQRVAVIPGTAFSPNGEGFVRMCYASSIDNINKALERLDAFLRKFDKRATEMKYILIIGDGMADNPVESLGGKTPLEFAKSWKSTLARAGEVGTVRTVPAGLPAGSDTAILSIFGCDPRVATGAPLEAAAGGLLLEPGSVAYRCNMVTFEDGDMPSRRRKSCPTPPVPSRATCPTPSPKRS